MEFDDLLIAQMVHEQGRVLQDWHGDDHPSQPWFCETAAIKATAVNGVKSARKILMAMDTADFAMPDFEAAAAELHAQWCTWYREAGWTCAPEKSPDARTHPCLVPWRELPGYQQVKSVLFISTVAVMEFWTGDGLSWMAPAERSGK